MMPNVAKAALITLVSLALHAPRHASAQTSGGAGVVETIEVKNADRKDTKHPSLRFLKDNRVFLRAQLDRLRLQVTRTRTDDASIVDERFLKLTEMSNAIAAARDTVRAEDDVVAGRELMASVTELGAIEDELNRMRLLLSDEQGRLLALEDDFLGHQETAMVIVLRGLGATPAPDAVVLTDQDDVVTVELTAEQRAALEGGGIAQLYHEFVEPREHAVTVGFAGSAAWASAAPVTVVVDAPRDRMTFLQLDLGHVDRDRADLGLVTSVWYR